MTEQIRIEDQSKSSSKKGFVRTSGLIAFAIIGGLLSAGAYFFAAPLIKSSIESTGTTLNGAQVAVDKVSLDLFPPSITLRHMTVADADRPMQNLVEFSQASASVDLLKLLMGQVIISELRLDGLQFETARTSSGAIAKSEEISVKTQTVKEDVKNYLSDVSQELPSAKEILEREPLLIDQRKSELDDAYKSQKNKWDNIEAKLPDSNKLKDYEKRVKAITRSKIKTIQDFEKQRAALKQLKAELKADQKTLKQAQSFLKESKDLLVTHVTNLKNAPKEDWERIKSKYSFDQQGLTNLSSLLFGDKIAQYTEQSLYWYHKVEPYLDNLSGESEEAEKTIEKAEKKWGRFVRFPEESPSPDFLIKSASISTLLPQGDVNVDILEITHQQYITGKPTRLKAQSSALKGIHEFNLDGVFDYREDVSKIDLTFDLDDTNINQAEIGSSGDISLELGSALADINGQVRLKDHTNLDGSVNAVFSQAAFEGKAANRFTEELLAALQTISEFSIAAKLGGSIENIDANISSDLDRRLKNAFSNRFNQRKEELRKKINEQLQQKLTEYLPEAGALDFAEAKSLDDYSKQIEGLLKTKIDDFKKQQLEKAKGKLKDIEKEQKDKLKEQLSNKLKGLF